MLEFAIRDQKDTGLKLNMYIFAGIDWAGVYKLKLHRIVKNVLIQGSRVQLPTNKQLFLLQV